MIKPMLLVIGGAKIWVRQGTSDERCAREVLEQHVYRRVRLGFDVEPGEHWLDLGANIGAFAVYCRERGAQVMCYEPEPECYQILRRNAPHSLTYPYAVTDSHENQVPFYTSFSPQDHYRGTVIPKKRYNHHAPVLNMFAGNLAAFSLQKHSAKFDGIKMDIEGSEGPILDKWFLPRAEKLVLEYHSSRDPSPVNLARRLGILSKHYQHLHYPKMFDLAIAQGNTVRPRFDRFIFAWKLR